VNRLPVLTNIKYELEIDAPIGKVYEYYTDPENIKKTWPSDIVKESGDISGAKNEEGAEIEVMGEYMGQEEQMKLEVTQKEENKNLSQNKLKGHLRNGKVFKNFMELEIVLM
jgi:uncharacterized protein YndB with AHSA1/START domain